MQLKLRSKILIVVMVLALVPICLVTVLSVRSVRAELGKTVRADMVNMTGFVWQILEAHERLAHEAEIGDEIVFLLQAREQEKSFALKEDEASIARWREIMAKLKASPIWQGATVEVIGRYEDLFLKFTQGKLANIGELDKAGAALEAAVRRAATVFATVKYQESIRERIIGPKRADGMRDQDKGILIGRTGGVYFLKPDGAVVGHPCGEGKSLGDASHIRSICAKKDGEVAYREQGVARMAFFKYYPGWDWIVVLDVVQSEVMDVRQVVISGIAVFAAVALVVALVAFVFARSLVRPIQAVIAGVTQSSGRVSSASGQVSASSQELAQGASEQASSLEETSSALEEMASMTRQSADNASQANATAKEASSLAETGVESMERMTEAIARIKTSASETAKIIKTIDEIAFQTNLLALNAAVEAARAGEAGKGFAVVAEEVRNLARRSAEAAKTTADLIEGSQKNADAGVAVTAEVAKNLGGIKENVGKVATLIGEIASASKEQSQGIDQVNTAVSEMDKVVQRNAANAEKSASAAQELTGQASELGSMVDQLVGIVGGANAKGQQSATGGGKERQATQSTARAGGVPQHRAGGKPEAALQPRNEEKRNAPRLAQASGGRHGAVKPEEVIPLDDKDLGNF
jgi:methyl-accepting chemotaxis protein